MSDSGHGKDVNSPDRSALSKRGNPQFDRTFSHDPSSFPKEPQNQNGLHYPSPSSSTNTLPRTVSTSSLRRIQKQDQYQKLQYQQQERAYLARIRNTLFGEPHSRSSADTEPDTAESSLEDDDDQEEQIGGFGGMGTSFDDAYTDLSSTYKFVESERLGVHSRAKLRERTEWQAMLTSVLTGEVFTSEKTRLKGSRSSYYTLIDPERWVEFKAKVLGRTIEEQRRQMMISRSAVSNILDEVANFKMDESPNSIIEAYNTVDTLLNSLYLCESLWPTLAAMKNEVPQYAQEDLQMRIEALTAWHQVTGAILQESRLLQAWTGNQQADPSMPPDPLEDQEATVSLAERLLKQDDALSSVFRNRIQRYIFPLMSNARRTADSYVRIFVELGLPVLVLVIEPVMKFPCLLIRDIINMRLELARKLVNPSVTMIDQTIAQFQQDMNLGLLLTSEYLEITQPLFDKGWFFSHDDMDALNKSLLECITLYLELLVMKFLDGGKSSTSFFRSFKSIEQLEEHYDFLSNACLLIEGGSISVAERFTSLLSRVFSRLLSYWEHQISATPVLSKHEIQRWFAGTTENMRRIQRKLLRFYKTLSDSYENSCEYSLPRAKMKHFFEEIRENGLLLVFIGTLEREGIYTFAGPNLHNHPQLIKGILEGSSRVRQSDENEGEEDPEPGCLLLLAIEEPLVWEGDIYHFDVPVNTTFDLTSRVRLVSQGGYAELCRVRQKWSFLETLDLIVPRRAQMAKVYTELVKCRSLVYKLSHTVISDVQQFHVKVRSYECQETVQSLLSFAREFGQRGLPTMAAARRGRVALKLIDLCVDWVSFVSDDCPHSEPKTFRWTVVALEFAMIMTRGVNIVAISDEKFTKLRHKVADCIALLISHFDIMGARSKAQLSKNKFPRIKSQSVALENEDELLNMMRESTLEKIQVLDKARDQRHAFGKVLDDSNTEFEFLNFASSSFSNASIRWQLGRYIGSGAFGSVYEALNLDNGQMMAVKEVRLQNQQSIRHILKSIKDEMTVLEMLRHPNVIQYYGVEVHRDRVLIFMEFCANGSLARLLEYGRIEDETVTQIYALQLLEGLAYLHQSGIVHRDIKPENILLDNMGVVKFVDFGTAKVIANTTRTLGATPEKKTRMGSITGTPMYMSPEVITGKDAGYHGSMDIWSLGCCVLEMVTGRRPWPNLDNEWAIMYHIAAEHMPTMPTDDQASPACQAFLLRTLERDPNKRPSAMELLQDPWIVSIRNQLLNTGDETKSEIGTDLVEVGPESKSDTDLVDTLSKCKSDLVEGEVGSEGNTEEPAPENQ